jgi:hypothetical protein
MFRHNDVEHLEERPAPNSTPDAPKLIAFESVYSMDGDIAPHARHLRPCRQVRRADLPATKSTPSACTAPHGGGISERDECRPPADDHRRHAWQKPSASSAAMWRPSHDHHRLRPQLTPPASSSPPRCHPPCWWPARGPACEHLMASNVERRRASTAAAATLQAAGWPMPALPHDGQSVSHIVPGDGRLIPIKAARRSATSCSPNTASMCSPSTTRPCLVAPKGSASRPARCTTMLIWITS